MCPALMFAANRNDSVIGRTMILIVSIKIRNGFNHKGAPSGRKCAVNCFQLFIDLEIIIFSHIGSPIDSVKIRWLDKESEYGLRPIKLIMIIIMNIDDRAVIMPLIWLAIVRVTCCVITIAINDININVRLYINQYINLIIIIIGIVIDREIVVFIFVNLNGSNDEKISGIIKIWNVHLELWRFLVYLT
jgi:hypothetical protein